MRVRVIALLPLIALAACTTGRSDGSAQILTPEQATTENMQGAVSSPLRDLNVVRTEIPDILLQAMADPYARPSRPVTCGKLIALIVPLDETLGPDLDLPAGEDPQSDRNREAALGAVATVASGAIPFRGWVRQLTGAQRHERTVQAAILAGSVRRSYLKGLGEARGCKPPATPSHVLAGSPVISQKPNLKPRYGIR